MDTTESGTGVSAPPVGKRVRPPMGSVERGLLRQGLRYALGLRLLVVGLSSIVSLFLAPAPDQLVAVGIVLALNAWNGCYAYFLARDSGRLRRWLVPLDIAVLCGVCLAQVWTVTSNPMGGATWVFIAVKMTLVTYPWQLGWRALMVAIATIVTAYYVGTRIADPGGWLVSETVVLWTSVEALLSWGIYRFVRRSAQTADRVVERGEQLRRDAAVADARRVDEREYLAALHDTASATLLMVGAGVVQGRERWLAEQAARDLREINGSDLASTADVDLLDLLREVAGHTQLRISWHGAGSVRMPAVDAVLLSRGAREALTNVIRHAGTDQAEIHVRHEGDTILVEITDHGRGFDPEQVPDHRYGVTRSLVERMARAGGGTQIISSPGSGTTVRMSYPLSVAQPAGDDDAKMIDTSFQRGLRWGVVMMSLAILLGLDLPRILANQDGYLAVWPQFVTWGGLFGVTLVVAGATWRDRSLGRWRWVLLVLVFALSVLGTATVRPEQLLGAVHWSEGDAGWQVVLLMMDSRVGIFAAVLAAQYAMTFVQAALVGQAALSVAGVVNATWVVLAYQLAIAMIATVLRGLAVTSAKAARADEQLRTAEAVARQLHQDRVRRYAALADTAVPLLQGLASGEMDPAEESVRRSCAVEAARMRRLFAEGSTVPDPLLYELRACIETAERLGVSVSFAACGSHPVLPTQVRRRLTEPAVAVLAAARGKARVTVASADQAVTVSVLAECSVVETLADSDGVRISTVQHGDRLWIQATWHND